MKQIFDLHLHTNYSDGEFSVEDLLKQIYASNLKYFSITDHDSIDCIKDIYKFNLGDLIFIKGIEISSILDGKYKMHILGYNIDENNSELLDVISFLKKSRIKRFYELANSLFDKYNFKINKKDLDEIIEKVNIPGKTHLAKLMINYGYVESVSEAFEKYLDNIKTETSNRIDAKIAINAIKKAGGIAILAHPKKIETEYNIDIQNILSQLIDIGLDGIEICNSLHTVEDYKKYLSIANKYNLITSGGSDYHGYNIKPNVKIGVVFKEDEDYLVDIKNINILKGKKIVNNNFNNIMKVEGLRDFFKEEVYEVLNEK